MCCVGPRTLVSRVDALGDEQAAGLGLGAVRVSQGQLVGREPEGVVAHLAAVRPVGTDPAEHGLLLGAVHRGGHWGGGEGEEGLEGRQSTWGLIHPVLVKNRRDAFLTSNIPSLPSSI